MLKCDIKTKVHGIINIKLIRNGVCHTDLTFKNLILDTFFSRFANNDTTFGSMECRVGSGTTPPANTDTALGSSVATKSQTAATDSLGSIDVPNNRVVGVISRQFEFVQGSVVATLAEVGFEFAKSSGGLFPGTIQSRSLIKDSFGTPTPLTVTIDDQLVVNYRFEVWIPLTDYIGTVSLGGVSYDVVGRVAAGFNTTVSNMLSLPSAAGNARACGSASVFGAHGIDATLESGAVTNTIVNFLNVSGGKEYEIIASINQLNATGGIKVFVVPHSSNGKLFKYQFTPVIPKTNSNVLKLRFRMTCVRV